MSRRVALPLLLAALLSAPASAQQPRSADELANRIDALRPQLERARSEMEEAQRLERLEEARREHPPVDTIAVGPMRIVTPPDQVDLARELFTEVWREHFANVTGSPSLAARYFTFQWRLLPTRIYMTPPEEGGAPVTRVDLYRLTDRSRTAVERRIRVSISGALTEDFARGTPLRDWLWAYRAGDLQPAAAYRQLALWASIGGAFRECLAADTDACWTAAWLDAPDPESMITASLSPDEETALVRRAAEAAMVVAARNGFTGDPPDLSPCLVERVESVCERYVPGGLDWYMDSAGGTGIRWTLFWHAIRRGGAGAWERALARADAPPGDVLTHASGLDADELVAGWLETLLAARPDLRGDLSATRWAVFLWILIPIALAMRSTRWRLR